MNQKKSSPWKLSFFATSILALAATSAAMAYENKENIIVLENNTIATESALPSVVEANTEILQQTDTPKTKKVTITPISSVVADIEPMIVVDGVVCKKTLSTIIPETISSMNVLKGAAAVEKYGNDGANGVIEITTKKQAAQIDKSGHFNILLLVKDEDPITFKYPKAKIDNLEKYKQSAIYIVSKKPYINNEPKQPKIKIGSIDLNNLQMATEEEKKNEDYIMILVSEPKKK